MKTKTVTFNMPVDLHWQLRVLVGPMHMSQFVCGAVREKISEAKKKLRYSYMKAEKDRKRTAAIHEWNITEGENWQ